MAVESLWNKQAQDEKVSLQAKEEKLRVEQLKEEARLKEEEQQKRKEGKDIRAMFSSKTKKGTKKDNRKKHQVKISQIALEELSTTEEKTQNKQSHEAPDEEKVYGDQIICQTEPSNNCPDEDNNELFKLKKRRKNKKGLDFLKIKYVGSNDTADEEKTYKVPSKDIRHMFAQTKQECDELVKVKSPPIQRFSVFNSLTQDKNTDVLLNDINSNIEIKLEPLIKEADKIQENHIDNLFSHSDSQGDIKEEKPTEKVTNVEPTNMFTRLQSSLKSDKECEQSKSTNTNESKTGDTPNKNSKRKRSNNNREMSISKKLKQCEEKENPAKMCFLRPRQIQNSNDLRTCDTDSDKKKIKNQQESTNYFSSTEQDIATKTSCGTLRRSRRSKQKVNYSEDYSNVETDDNSCRNVSKERMDLALDKSIIEIISSKEQVNHHSNIASSKKDGTVNMSSDSNKVAKPVIGKYTFVISL